MMLYFVWGSEPSSAIGGFGSSGGSELKFLFIITL